MSLNTYLEEIKWWFFYELIHSSLLFYKELMEAKKTLEVSLSCDVRKKKWKSFLFLLKFTFSLLIKKNQDIWASRSAMGPGHWVSSVTVEKSRGFQANGAILRSGKWGRWWFDSRHFKLLFWHLLAGFCILQS